MKNAWVRWTVLIAGGLTAAVLAAAGALFFLVSRLDVRGEIERAVETATGRDLTISGAVGVSFWPVLGLRAHDAQLANVAGGRAPALVAMDEIDVGVELRPLLDREVVVRQLLLRRPRIALEVDAEGRPNWLLRAAAGATAPQPQAPAVEAAAFTLKQARIIDGEMSFFDARRGAGWVIGAVNLTTSVVSMGKPMRVVGEVRYNDRTVALNLQAARFGATMAGQVSPIKLELRGDLLSADFDGQTTAASGELAGVVNATGPSLRQLAAWTGSPIVGGAGLEQFSVSGRIAIGGGRLDFSNAGFTLERLRGRGDFALSQNRGRPYLSGRLELFDFDLNPLISGQAAAPAAAQAAPGPASAPGEAAGEAPPRALDIAQAPSEAALDFSGLKAFDADLELTTGALTVQHLRIDRSVFGLVVHDGFMAATLHELALYGGSGRGRFEIDARLPVVRLAQDLTFQGVDAQRFLADAINLPMIEGRGELSLNLRTQGRTQTEMIANADGLVHVEIVSGALRGVDLGGVARTIRNAMRGELIAPEARTRFHGFSANFFVADGVLASDNLSFNTPDLAIPGIGLIDLNARRIDMRLAPRAPAGGVAIPFSVRGPWAGLTYDSDLRARARTEIEPRVRAVQAAARAR